MPGRIALGEDLEFRPASPSRIPPAVVPVNSVPSAVRLGEGHAVRPAVTVITSVAITGR
jgi:hypothetical protein